MDSVDGDDDDDVYKISDEEVKNLRGNKRDI